MQITQIIFCLPFLGTLKNIYPSYIYVDQCTTTIALVLLKQRFYYMSLQANDIHVVLYLIQPWLSHFKNKRFTFLFSQKTMYLITFLETLSRFPKKILFSLYFLSFFLCLAHTRIPL